MTVLRAASPPSCGDGVVQVGVEDCDDGNENPFDACSNDCSRAQCGDGEVEEGEG